MQQLSNNRRIQQQDLAGRTKLTAVTVGHGNHKRTIFIQLQHDYDGQAIMPMSSIDKLLSNIYPKLQCDATWSHG